MYQIACMNASLGLLESWEKVVISDKGSGHTHEEGWAELIALKTFLPPVRLKQVTHHRVRSSYNLILPQVPSARKSYRPLL